MMTPLHDTASTPASLICPRCRRLFDPSRVFCPDDGARLADQLEPDAADVTPVSLSWRRIAGRYELNTLIGHGSMARVYSGTDLETGRSVAIKMLGRRFVGNERESRRFLREARALLHIDHPAVVKVLDVGKCLDGRPFLVIEQLVGESLGDCVRRKGRIPLDLALRIAHEAALGLCAVHASEIVHRDVKPDNVFLLGEPDAVEGVRLFDFGLAKLHAHEESSQSALVVGTAAYMAPEQVVSEAVDARADVYALGVVLFRAITGHLPFDASNDFDLVAQQVLLPIPPVSWFLEGIDPRLDRVVARAMRKRPENRYPTMRAFADDLSRLRYTKESLLAEEPMAFEPDEYEPVSEQGRQAHALLRRRLGILRPE